MIRIIDDTTNERINNIMKTRLMSKLNAIPMRYLDNMENYLIDQYSNLLSDKIKSTFGFEIQLFEIEKANKFFDWIRPYYKVKDTSAINFRNKIALVKLDKNTYCYYTTYDKISNNRPSFRIESNYNSPSYDGESRNMIVYIYIFGKKSYKYYNQINRLYDVSQDTLLLYSVSGSGNSERQMFNSMMSDLNKRNIDTLFYENNVKENIISHIDAFLKNVDIYQKRNLIYKTGIMLYGEPGTGKTSLASAIATYYNCYMISIDMATFSTLDTAMLTECISVDDKRYVILMEDIDCIFNNLDRENGEDITIEEKKLLNKLQQFLDGTNSPSNVIFLATTNHIDKLDSSILRAGRFDLKLEVGGIHKKKAIEMCESFELDDTAVESIINSIDSFPVNQSHLQELILNKLKESIK